MTIKERICEYYYETVNKNKFQYARRWSSVEIPVEYFTAAEKRDQRTEGEERPEGYFRLSAFTLGNHDKYSKNSACETSEKCSQEH